MEYNTTVINFFAGPGAGKTSSSFTLASELKWRGINIEYVPEYAKELTWGSEWETLDNQLHVSVEQYKRIKRLNGKVEFIITDSPIILGVNYLKNEHSYKDSFKDVIFNCFNEFNNVNYFLYRKKKYLNKGRTETEEESIIIDKKIETFLLLNGIDYTILDGVKDNFKIILNELGLK